MIKVGVILNDITTGEDIKITTLDLDHGYVIVKAVVSKMYFTVPLNLIGLRYMIKWDE